MKKSRDFRPDVMFPMGDVFRTPFRCGVARVYTCVGDKIVVEYGKSRRFVPVPKYASLRDRFAIASETLNNWDTSRRGVRSTIANLLCGLFNRKPIN